MSKINSAKKDSEICQSQNIVKNSLNQDHEGIQDIEKISIGDKGNVINFLNSISDILEEKTSKNYSNVNSEKTTINDIAFALDTYFEDKDKENFEWYQRAGKFFFRYEHDLGKEQSKTMKKSFETIVKNKMKKDHGHYIITPNSTSVVFR